MFKNIVNGLKERAMGGWRTSVLGAAEGLGISGVSEVLNLDPKTQTFAFALAAWRVIYGLGKK
jgi:hypothetical protein